MQTKLKRLFSDFVDRDSIFTNKDALTPTYLPEVLLHREKEIEHLANILAPTLKGERPSNVLIFGWTGVGKTIVSKVVCKELEDFGASTNQPIRTVYINCKMEKINTEYRLLARLCKELGLEVPITGLPTDEIYKSVYDLINSEQITLIIVLDEVDSMDQASAALYDITRINYELTNKSKVCVVGISNDLNFIDSLEPKVKSSFSGEELVFAPYDATQLRDILNQRAKEAFQPEAVDEGIISKCAALAAQEHGDARRALNLLRVAAELADRTGKQVVTELDLERAEDRIDLETITAVVKTLPRQSQVVLWSILEIGAENVQFATGDVFDYYHRLCNTLKFKPLTQRRVSDLISELDILGIITAKVISKGRYGRTREISLALSQKQLSKIRAILREELML